MTQLLQSPEYAYEAVVPPVPYPIPTEPETEALPPNAHERWPVNVSYALLKCHDPMGGSFVFAQDSALVSKLSSLRIRGELY